MTKHVVAEVLIGGRWIVVDPAFRVILRGNDGGFLTRGELANPVVLSAAIKDIPGYRSDYTFDRTAHVRMARLIFVGLPLRGVLDRLFPSWQDSMALSLLLERASLTTVVLATILVFLFGSLRLALRWYGEKHLGVRLHPDPRTVPEGVSRLSTNRRLTSVGKLLRYHPGKHDTRVPSVLSIRFPGGQYCVNDRAQLSGAGS